MGSAFRKVSAPPASVVAYIEDMLNELAEMAVEAGEPMLAPAIRAAANAAAEAQDRRTGRPGPPLS